MKYYSIKKINTEPQYRRLFPNAKFSFYRVRNRFYIPTDAKFVEKDTPFYFTEQFFDGNELRFGPAIRVENETFVAKETVEVE